MRGVLISACPVSAAMARYLRPDDLVIACDAGYRNCKTLGVRPDLILGDFDSAPRPDWPEVIVLPCEKDDTDTQYAARLALEKGCDEVVMLGALGGWRLEHTMANYGTALWLARQGADVLLADERSEVRILLPGKTMTLDRADWTYFSIFPMEGRAEGITLEGAYYPLENAALDAGYPLGVSNAFAADTVRIRVKEGSLIVFCTRKEPG